jgi:hypothetical protein
MVNQLINYFISEGTLNDVVDENLKVASKKGIYSHYSVIQHFVNL